jgi:formate dehydrogenase subunit gamma
VGRFSRSERGIHWIHAAAFFVLLGSGLVLYLPRLSERVSRRPLIKDIHFYTGIAWAAALILIVLIADRRALRRTLRELDLFDDDDRRWLLGRRAPQGRFNAGQKVNFWLTAAFAILFFVTGLLLWYGERNTRFRLPSTLLVHDTLMYVSILLVAGHLFLALVFPPTRPALRGMLRGSVRAEWAREHHSKWVATDAGRSKTASESATTVLSE